MRNEDEREYMVDPEEARRIEREVRREALLWGGRDAGDVLRLVLHLGLWVGGVVLLVWLYVHFDPLGLGAKATAEREAQQAAELAAMRASAEETLRAATPWRLTRDGWYAALQLQHLKEAVAVAEAQDMVALQRLFDARSVIVMQGGVRVQIMEQAGPFVCIRVQGKNGCIWTEDAALTLE